MRAHLLVAAIVAVVTPGRVMADLLANPGFESWVDDSTPTAWRVEQRSRTTTVRQTDTVHTGSAACRLIRLIAGVGDNRGVLQRVPAEPGVRYRYQARCRDDSPQISLGISISWRDADSAYIGTTGVEYSTDATNWQLVLDSAISPPATAFADVIIRTYGVSGAPAGLRVICDDAYFGPAVFPPETTRLWFVQDSLAARLIEFVNGAAVSLDYCCYNSSRPDVTLALIAAHNRGVRLRVITDNARLNNSWVAFLRGSGITVWTDSIGPNAASYMHNKFALRDLADADTTNDWLWNASYNPNDNETNADYALEMPASSLARSYLLEFNQMWGDTGMLPDPTRAKFHTGKIDRLPTHEFAVGGSRCRLYFAPQNRVVDTVRSVATAAEREVGFAINAFTHDGLGAALLQLHASGRRVFGTFDRANVGDSASEYHLLRPGGVPVLIDSVPFGNGTLHEKVMVIDSAIVICGSANWSNNANVSNDENTLIIYDAGLARRFLDEVITRYIEAGGTYPPAIEESIEPSTSTRTGSLTSPRPVPVAGVRTYDAAGRAQPTPARPGIYFAVDRDGNVTSYLLVR